MDLLSQQNSEQCNRYWKRSTGSAPVNAPPLTEFAISDEKILNIIRSLNPNKAYGWDDISVGMIRMCDDSLVFSSEVDLRSMSKTRCFPGSMEKS